MKKIEKLEKKKEEKNLVTLQRRYMHAASTNMLMKQICDYNHSLNFFSCI